MESPQEIHNSEKIITSLKTGTFNSYFASIFLYTYETWSLAFTLEEHRAFFTHFSEQKIEEVGIHGGFENALKSNDWG